MFLISIIRTYRIFSVSLVFLRKFNVSVGSFLPVRLIAHLDKEVLLRVSEGRSAIVAFLGPFRKKKFLIISATVPFGFCHILLSQYS
jgi:hypothetical protein